VRAAVRLASCGTAMAAFGATAALAVALNRPASAPAALTTDTRPHSVPACTATALAVSLADGTGSSAGAGSFAGTGASRGIKPSKGAGLAKGPEISGGAAVPAVLAYPVEFTNTSDSPCALSGYPTVTAYDARPGGYRQVGNTAAADASMAPPRVVLRPGATAHSDVDLTSVVPGVACRPVTVTGLRVVPPGASRPEYLRVQLTTCSATGPQARACLHVRPVQPGTGIALGGDTAKDSRRHGAPANPE